MAIIEYADNIPEFIEPFLSSKEMIRLKKIGMNCGCEYTNFPRFKNLMSYSRFEHSLGTSLIVWNFTKSKEQTLSALFHDISTPVFSHTIDFYNDDYLKQQSTESLTEWFIVNSDTIKRELSNLKISPENVINYHIYPIADNDSPKLSADRLEYTIGNSYRYHFADSSELKKIYDDIAVSLNEYNEIELCFNNTDIAMLFGKISLQCSEVYVSDEDRYSMETLSNIMKQAVVKSIITENDFYTTEDYIIELITNSCLKGLWFNYRKLSHINYSNNVPEDYKQVIYAKKRFIDPYIVNKGRLSYISDLYKSQISKFLATDFSVGIYAE